MARKHPKLNYRARGPETVSPDLLEVIDYRYAGKDIEITIEQPEYTSVCPMTGLPDFGKITIFYIPNRSLVELKSLKFYLLQYRNVGIFYEHLVHHILDHLVARVDPKTMTVSGEFTPRGGITTRVKAVYEKPRRR
ncbi:MAG: NADPH-dependent 7-cyano-7-deazaguanine reductase QueF [Deltaproteobacteria bacterium]|nr:NADPH-dependent 7-cyano-7-deazaguanine reductase QueF [Deltaproteobacteria bacterium]MBW1956175.1 NADPH-dependent 7-cyano-7-deazaguanine reductase QueF [Deltaproteobacteria bacterium]MBW2042733.1 NADPH-dependent 7-cyano-7-deazaguanine reductase QueF [Deltaproteobacteria bacterium]MBW2132161.1 NADPH-dependent 7-cyano-7-deazaguanine reductase QueF [Deltaproteobacteria bacterium]